MIETSLPQTGIGELDFAAAAKLEITADTAVGPWVAFELFEKLKVDSARWEGGEPATFFRGKESPLLWVRLDRPDQPGESGPCRLYYHGDLIDRYVDFFDDQVVGVPGIRGRSRAGAWPVSTSPSTRPHSLPARERGRRVDSSLTGQNRANPLGHARADPQRLVQSGSVQGLRASRGWHSAGNGDDLRGGAQEAGGVLVSSGRCRRRVGADMSKSLRFFQTSTVPRP